MIRSGLLVLLAAVVCAPAPASAQPEGQPDPPETDREQPNDSQAERPWAKGTTESQRTTALELYRRGNTFFEREQYGLAAKEYTLALASWNHPAIHFNLAVCLVELDRSQEALEHLEAGLAFGAAPRGPVLHRDGLRYKKLLERRIVTTLRVRTQQPGTEIRLDGNTLFTGPGEKDVELPPGKYKLTATKPNHESATEEVELSPGSDTVINLRATPIEITYRRRWDRWLPWAIAGAGLGLSATGLILDRAAQSSFDSFRDAIAECGGCEPSADVTSKKDTGNTRRIAAIATGTVGLGALIAGGILIYLNQPTAEQRPSSMPELSPTMSPDSAGISGTWIF